MKRRFSFEVLLVILLLGSGLAMYFWGFHNSLDARFYYSQGESLRFFEGLTTVEVEKYKRQEIFDFLFIAAYSGLFVRVLGLLFPKKLLLKSLGLVPGVLDVIETVTIMLVLLGIVPLAPLGLGFVTGAKWVASGLVLLFVAVASVRRKFI